MGSNNFCASVNYNPSLHLDNELESAGNVSSNTDLVIKIVEEHTHSLRTYFYNRLRCNDDVEDFMQELYFRALSYKEPTQIRSVKNFVFTIALNLVRDSARRCSTRLIKNSVPIEEDEFLDESFNPERTVENRDKIKKFYETMNELSPNCKKAFLLTRIDGLSYKEVALKMGVSVSMVEKHLIAASKNFREVGVVN